MNQSKAEDLFLKHPQCKEAFLDLWPKSYVEGHPPLYVDLLTPLGTMVRLSEAGLVFVGSVDSQDYYIWCLTKEGIRVGREILFPEPPSTVWDHLFEDED